MEREELAVKLNGIFRRVFNNENLEVSDGLTANDVSNWDSLSHMILIGEIEKALGITFKLKELNKMKNVGDMMDIILSKLQ
jgi:acyl carrier protein